MENYFENIMPLEEQKFKNELLSQLKLKKVDSSSSSSSSSSEDEEEDDSTSKKSLNLGSLSD